MSIHNSGLLKQRSTQKKTFPSSFRPHAVTNQYAAVVSFVEHENRNFRRVLVTVRVETEKYRKQNEVQEVVSKTPLGTLYT